MKRFDDKFINGFMAQIIAALITGPMSLAAKHFKLAELELADFAGMLPLWSCPKSFSREIVFFCC